MCMFHFFQYSEVMEKLINSPLENAFKTFDVTLTGTYNFPRRHILLFYFYFVFPVGPVYITLGMQNRYPTVFTVIFLLPLEKHW